MTIFVDSDVVISSLLSKTGASYILLYTTQGITPFVSDVSLKELEMVSKHLKISKDRLNVLLKERFKRVTLKETIVKIKDKYKEYTYDINDAHIVAGAKESHSRFLVSYNIKDFKVNRIKNDFNIIIMTPGKFLQYLISLR